jgi:hypothetical protein
MKHILILFSSAFIFFSSAYSQNETPQLLKGPANWGFERFALPPSFAPGIPFKGAEELRFSPGMFKKDSATYFTYAFVAELENTLSVSQNDINNYLLNYFKGLCSSVGKDKNLSVDTSAVKVAIEKKKGVKNFYNATLDIFGVFVDGAPVKLNMEIKVLNNDAAKKTYLFIITSPLDKKNKIWDELHAIQNDFTIP